MRRRTMARRSGPGYTDAMIDHIGIAVSDLARALAFYDRALAPLGMGRAMSFGGTDELPAGVGYGTGQKPVLWLHQGAPTSPFHIALAAPDRAAVDAFHAAALDAGGRDNGAPGLRPHYHPAYYAAFVHDPDGHNLEAVTHRG
jgi:catechol 2,3-dioxygenase-like lactoylglutathione lyase family enzyme